MRKNFPISTVATLYSIGRMGLTNPHKRLGVPAPSDRCYHCGKKGRFSRDVCPSCWKKFMSLPPEERNRIRWSTRGTHLTANPRMVHRTGPRTGPWDRADFCEACGRELGWDGRCWVCDAREESTTAPLSPQEVQGFQTHFGVPKSLKGTGYFPETLADFQKRKSKQYRKNTMTKRYSRKSSKKRSSKKKYSVRKYPSYKRRYSASKSSPHLTKIYDKAEQIFATGSVNSGSYGVHKTDKFTHRFTSRPAIYGVPKSGNYFLPAGALVLKGVKRLFKTFGPKSVSGSGYSKSASYNPSRKSTSIPGKKFWLAVGKGKKMKMHGPMSLASAIEKGNKGGKFFRVLKAGTFPYKINPRHAKRGPWKGKVGRVLSKPGGFRRLQTRGRRFFPLSSSQRRLAGRAIRKAKSGKQRGRMRRVWRSGKPY